MDADLLVCNFKDCFKELSNAAYLTFCSHIFCVDHGEKLKANLKKGCFACKGDLLEHQVFETKLSMSSESNKLLLAGQNPKTILEVSLNALSFWFHQKKLEIAIIKRREEHYKQKLQLQTKAVEEAMKEKDSRLFSSTKEVEKLKEERAALKAELAALKEDVHLAKKAKKDDFF